MCILYVYVSLQLPFMIHYLWFKSVLEHKMPCFVAKEHWRSSHISACIHEDFPDFACFSFP